MTKYQCISEDCANETPQYGICDTCSAELAEMSRMPGFDDPVMPMWRMRALYPIITGNTMNNAREYTPARYPVPADDIPMWRRRALDPEGTGNTMNGMKDYTNEKGYPL